MNTKNLLFNIFTIIFAFMQSTTVIAMNGAKKKKRNHSKLSQSADFSLSSTDSNTEEPSNTITNSGTRLRLIMQKRTYEAMPQHVDDTEPNTLDIQAIDELDTLLTEETITSSAHLQDLVPQDLVPQESTDEATEIIAPTTENLCYLCDEEAPQPGQLQQLRIIKEQKTLGCTQGTTHSHHYHDHCLEQWLSTRVTCPSCRQPIILTRKPRNLHQAAEYGDRIALAELLTEETNTTVQDKDGNTPLHIAAQWNCSEAAQEIINYSNAAINIRNKAGETPLHIAIRYNHLTSARVLLNNGALTTMLNNKQQTALHLAVLNGKQQLVELLILAGAALDNQDKAGNTALHLAIQLELFDIASLLLNSGCDRNLMNKKRQTALDIATAKRNASLIQLLNQSLS